jgi:hypothetical protein
LQADVEATDDAQRLLGIVANDDLDHDAMSTAKRRCVNTAAFVYGYTDSPFGLITVRGH